MIFDVEGRSKQNVYELYSTAGSEVLVPITSLQLISQVLSVVGILPHLVKPFRASQFSSRLALTNPPQASCFRSCSSGNVLKKSVGCEITPKPPTLDDVSKLHTMNVEFSSQVTIFGTEPPRLAEGAGGVGSAGARSPVFSFLGSGSTCFVSKAGPEGGFLPFKRSISA